MGDIFKKIRSIRDKVLYGISIAKPAIDVFAPEPIKKVAKAVDEIANDGVVIEATVEDIAGKFKKKKNVKKT